jgi:hypothetical protein
MSTTTIKSGNPGQMLERMAADTLTGDVRDVILQFIKWETAAKPWNQRSADEQQKTLNRVTNVAENLVRQAVKLIATHGMTAVPGALESVTIKDGVKAALLLSKADDAWVAAAKHQGGPITLILSSMDDFMGQREEIEIYVEENQMILPLDSEEEAERAQGDAYRDGFVDGYEDGEKAAVPVAYWVPTDDETPAPRFATAAEALIDAGAATYEPRMVTRSDWTTPQWGVMLAVTAAAGHEVHLFATLGAASKFAAKAKKEGQEAALADLVAAGT